MMGHHWRWERPFHNSMEAMRGNYAAASLQWIVVIGLGMHLSETLLCGSPRITDPGQITMPMGGVATVFTTGTAPGARTGYVPVSVDTGVTPFGTAVLSLTQNGIVVSEAAIPTSPPTPNARLFVDYRHA